MKEGTATRGYRVGALAHFDLLSLQFILITERAPTIKGLSPFSLFLFPPPPICLPLPSTPPTPAIAPGPSSSNVLGRSPTKVCSLLDLRFPSAWFTGGPHPNPPLVSMTIVLPPWQTLPAASPSPNLIANPCKRFIWVISFTNMSHSSRWHLHCNQDKNPSNRLRVRGPLLLDWPTLLQDGSYGGRGDRTRR